MNAENNLLKIDAQHSLDEKHFWVSFPVSICKVRHAPVGLFGWNINRQYWLYRALISRKNLVCQ